MIEKILYPVKKSIPGQFRVSLNLLCYAGKHILQVIEGLARGFFIESLFLTTSVILMSTVVDFY